MRIIAGKNRGTKLYTLEGNNITRPTLDRVKESLFSILLPYLEDSIVLDLFSGSGSLGLEAISRGAKKAVLCDKSYKAINIIKQNIEKTKLQNDTCVLSGDFKKILENLGKNNEEFDIIFLDPPYDTNYIKESVDLIVENNILAESGIIVAETDAEGRINKQLSNSEVNIIDVRKYGHIYIMLLGKRKG